MLIKMLTQQKNAVFSLLLVVLVSACTVQAQQAKPALLPVDNAAARTEIIALIKQSLQKKSIAIANDAFQHSSRLLLGKKPITSPEGISIISHNRENIIVFELTKQGKSCLLTRINTTQTWLLTTQQCFIAE